jgi:plastocyanin
MSVSLTTGNDLACSRHEGATIMVLHRRRLVGLVFVLMTGCADRPSPTAPSPNGPAVTTTIVNGAARLTTDAFAPNPVDIPAGTTVTWVNNDSTVHSSTSNAGVWASPAMIPGDRFSFTFQSAGTFTYRCAIHPNMVGTITVR